MNHIQYQDIIEFTTLALESAGLDKFSIDAVTTGLCETSLRGIDSHGIRLLPHYINSAQSGRKNPCPAFKITKKYPATGLLDADNAFGHSAGMKAIDECIKMASEYGVGILGVSNSSHPGAMASFGLRAARQGYISISMTHADSLQKTHDGKRAYFGTNPICFTAPRKDMDPYCLDMATSMISWNKVLLARENNQTLDKNLAADENGVMTTDPNKARSLLSAGSYKGYGLASMVEVLCGVFTGMTFGRDIPAMFTTPMDQARKLGQFYLVMKTDSCVDNDSFLGNMLKMSQEILEEPSFGDAITMLPGDREIIVAKERLENGIPLDESTSQALKELALKLNLVIKIS
jgi:ureidoglycolate dehydrogenase (NAD+)